jgi:hypothetical protein
VYVLLVDEASTEDLVIKIWTVGSVQSCSTSDQRLTVLANGMWYSGRVV